MGRRTITKETTEMEADELSSAGNGARRVIEDPADPVNLDREEALRLKYQYAAKRHRIAIEELDSKAKKGEAEEDDVDKMRKDMIKQLTDEAKIANLRRMANHGEESNGKKHSDIEGLTRELKEAFSYLDKRLDSVTGEKSQDRFMQMQMAQQRESREAADRQMQAQIAAQQQMFQMMMAMMNKPDPNASMTQNMMMKLMDQKATIKDILPMMTQMQTMGMAQSAELEKSRMAIMQEVVLHALSAGEKDWDTMSIMEKADFITGMLKKSVGFGVDKIKEMRARKYEPGKEPKGLDKAKEIAKIGLGLAEDDQPALPPPGVAPATAPEGTPSSQPAVAVNPPPAQVGSTEDAELKAIIADRVNRMLKVVDTEMRLGSDPFVVFEELEKLYFGLPQEMRNKIESDENPLMLVQAIEPFADKTLLDKITQMAISDQTKADWLKEFHQAVLGIEPDDGGGEEEEEEETEEDAGDAPEAPAGT